MLLLLIINIYCNLLTNIYYNLLTTHYIFILLLLSIINIFLLHNRKYSLNLYIIISAVMLLFICEESICIIWISLLKSKRYSFWRSIDDDNDVVLWYGLLLVIEMLYLYWYYYYGSITLSLSLTLLSLSLSLSLLSLSLLLIICASISSLWWLCNNISLFYEIT